MPIPWLTALCSTLVLYHSYYITISLHSNLTQSITATHSYPTVQQSDTTLPTFFLNLFLYEIVCFECLMLYIRNKFQMGFMPEKCRNVYLTTLNHQYVKISDLHITSKFGAGYINTHIVLNTKTR